jgi:hypothetical protein
MRLNIEGGESVCVRVAERNMTELFKKKFVHLVLKRYKKKGEGRGNE